MTLTRFRRFCRSQSEPNGVGAYAMKRDAHRVFLGLREIEHPIEDEPLA
jgi:hypothetical protein